jgi:hypothetical protein
LGVRDLPAPETKLAPSPQPWADEYPRVPRMGGLRCFVAQRGRPILLPPPLWGRVGVGGIRNIPKHLNPSIRSAPERPASHVPGRRPPPTPTLPHKAGGSQMRFASALRAPRRLPPTARPRATSQPRRRTELGAKSACFHQPTPTLSPEDGGEGDGHPPARNSDEWNALVDRIVCGSHGIERARFVTASAGRQPARPWARGRGPWRPRPRARRPTRRSQRPTRTRTPSPIRR